MKTFDIHASLQGIYMPLEAKKEKKSTEKQTIQAWHLKKGEKSPFLNGDPGKFQEGGSWELLDWRERGEKMLQEGKYPSEG